MRSEQRSIKVGRLGQSAQTGFFHLYADKIGGDTIPIYENFCFALTLISQKSIEGVSEGKDLIERLLAFQVNDPGLHKGNFPIYLHDYPRCWSALQPLKIAPPLVRVLHDWSHILDASFLDKIKLALNELISCAKRIREEKPYPPLWERRYFALLGEKHAMQMPLNAKEASQELITSHLLGESLDFFHGLIHPTFRIYNGPNSKIVQEGFEPKISLLEAWAGGSHGDLNSPVFLELGALCEKMPFTESSFRDSDLCGYSLCNQAGFALCFSKCAQLEEEEVLLSCLWKEERIRSLVFSGKKDLKSTALKTDEGVVFEIEWFTPFDASTSELAFFLDYAKEAPIWIGQKRATTFSINDTVSIRTPALQAAVRFEILEGSGDFCGQISRANRPYQIKNRGNSLHEAFDWKIALRALRRSDNVRFKVTIQPQSV